MPSRQKTLQTLFVQVVLVISLFALVGNLSVNFWERYMIETELAKMKTSLYSLKDTINHIDVAYNLLYTELRCLADIAEGKSLKHNTTIGDAPGHSSVTRKLLNDLQLRSMLENGLNVKDLPKNEIKVTGTRPKTLVFNETTSYNFSHYLNADKVDENVGTKEFRNKKLQAPRNDGRASRVKYFKNAETVTRYPLKSKGVGNDQNELQDTVHSKNHGNENSLEHMYKCHNNIYCNYADVDDDHSRF